MEGWTGVFILFIHSSSIHLLGTYYMLGSLLGVGDKVARKVYKFPDLCDWPEVEWELGYLVKAKSHHSLSHLKPSMTSYRAQKKTQSPE